MTATRTRRGTAKHLGTGGNKELGLLGLLGLLGCWRMCQCVGSGFEVCLVVLTAVYPVGIVWRGGGGRELKVKVR